MMALTLEQKRDAILYARVSPAVKEWVERQAEKLDISESVFMDAFLKKVMRDKGSKFQLNRKSLTQ